ncbi:hypothetical protein ABZ511_27600 [Nocardia gamkensis]|uniref:hypothetical protein n=1 Tax=Nocardia gamkensis TaxID=352869 RepID=UPI0033EE7AF0
MQSRGDDVAPIPGTKRRVYLEENVAAADIQLTTSNLARVDAAAPATAFSGARYLARLAKAAGR